MNISITSDYFKLLFFSIGACLIAYGFTLSNFSLSIDSEQVIYSDMSLILGRWGTNLVRYHIFGGIVPYFTLLLGLLFISFAAVEISRIFKFTGITAYIFCGLFLTFPQIAYQLVFTMQADVIGLGFFTGALSVRLFFKSINGRLSALSVATFITSALLFMFTIALYQALAFIPVIVVIIVLFQDTFYENYTLKAEIKKGLLFCALAGLSVVLYILSLKLLCPPGAGIASSYTSGSTGNPLINFFKLLCTHLTGRSFYGEKTFMVIAVIAAVLIIKFALRQRKLFVIRLLLLLIIIVTPFSISYFINSGYNPPRLYVASGIIFAFIITYFISEMKFSRPAFGLAFFLVITNVYFITMLFWSHYKVYNHDIKIAKNIDSTIQNTYPDFDNTKDYVYFYGCLPYAEHEKYRLPDSEIFGGSFFLWDNGSNNRIVNFMKFSDVADYKEIDNIETYNKIKDSITTMPIWPKKGYVKRVDNVIIVRLGEVKGAPLWVEM